MGQHAPHLFFLFQLLQHLANHAVPLPIVRRPTEDCNGVGIHAQCRLEGSMIVGGSGRRRWVFHLLPKGDNSVRRHIQTRIGIRRSVRRNNRFVGQLVGVTTAKRTCSSSSSSICTTMVGQLLHSSQYLFGAGTILCMGPGSRPCLQDRIELTGRGCLVLQGWLLLLGRTRCGCRRRRGDSIVQHRRGHGGIIGSQPSVQPSFQQ
jgi:hypothetical protein